MISFAHLAPYRKPPISIFSKELRPEREVWVLEALEILEIRRSGEEFKPCRKAPAWTPSISESQRQKTSTAAWRVGVAVARGFPGRLPAIFLSQTLVRGNLTQNFGWKQQSSHCRHCRRILVKKSPDSRFRNAPSAFHSRLRCKTKVNQLQTPQLAQLEIIRFLPLIDVGVLICPPYCTIGTVKI